MNTMYNRNYIPETRIANNHDKERKKRRKHQKGIWEAGRSMTEQLVEDMNRKGMKR